MVHNSRSLVRTLEAFIVGNVSSAPRSFSVSDPKADGSVTVRFRSSAAVSALELSDVFGAALVGTGRCFKRTDDDRFRLPLGQFAT